MGVLTSTWAVTVLGFSLAGNLLGGWYLSGHSASLAPQALAAAGAASSSDDCSVARECLVRLEQYHDLRVTFSLALGGIGWLAAVVTAVCYKRPLSRTSAAAPARSLGGSNDVVGVPSATIEEVYALDLDHYVPRRG